MWRGTTVQLFVVVVFFLGGGGLGGGGGIEMFHLSSLSCD